jgi:uncharacterized SAM-binding protein YcdF (DUF218 family)
MKIVWRIVKLIVLIGFILCIIIGAVIGSFGYFSKPKKSDCIIVLGCQVKGTYPSPFLAARLDEGIKLLKQGFSSYIIVSGGKGAGEEISEAEAMKNYLTSKGIDENRIIMEDKSLSTMENLKFSKAVMDSKGFKSVIIVSNKYHLKRASVMAVKNGITNANFSGVLVSKYPFREVMGFLREIPALMRLYILGR